MEICTRIENGKAYLSFDFAQELASISEEIAENLQAVFLQIQDRDGRDVLRSLYPLVEEEPACAILLHPHLWNGLEDPYQYKVILHLISTQGCVYEGYSQPLAIYTLQEMSGKGWFLNGKPFEVRAVGWDISRMEENEFQVLELLCEMGANTLYLPEGDAPREFVQSCMEKGFLVWENAKLAPDSPETIFCKSQKIPSMHILFSFKPLYCTDSFYLYKAKWGKPPFVYISMNSIKKNEKQHLSLTVYSNQKKVALYTNGTLFEFLTGGLEYFFEEIPIKKYPLTLTAEAGECRTAITIYETSHNFHRTVTFS